MKFFDKLNFDIDEEELKYGLIHESQKIFSNTFEAVKSSIQSSTVFDAKDKKTALKFVANRENEIMIPIMLAAAILNNL